MANTNLSEVISKCTTLWNTAISQNGIIKNADGTISVYVTNSNNVKAPYQVTKTCCETLATMTNEGYFYDLDSQKCKWSIVNQDEVSDKPFKIVLNPTGNDGSIFQYDANETCSLVVDFDYLLKFDCEVLSNILSPVTPIDSATLAKINNLQTQINQQTVLLEEVESDLNLYRVELDNLTYSIVCDSFPIQDSTLIADPQTSVTPTAKQIVPFSKTAFGNVAPFSFAYATKAVTYCLTEPTGLEVWESILGTNRYQSFLNGNADSYTCNDVINIFNQSASSSEVLIYECTTPFGAKTLVQNKINALELEQASLTVNILALQTELNQVQRLEANSCDYPMGILETMDVSMSIDLVEQNGDLTSVYDNNIFPAIGLGNLYEYLTLKGDKSGFFICGQPNSTETWTSGCTGLNFSASSLGQETNVTSCINIHDYFLNELYTESGYRDVTDGLTAFTTSLTPNVLASEWLHYSVNIDDKAIIEQITNQKIKLSLKINSSCGDFCVLVDNISLNKICTQVDRNDIVVSKSPGFQLSRVIDNKKSWVNNDSLISRVFDINNVNTNSDIRQTDYQIQDERLIINTKEIDLDLNSAKAVEYDVLTFIQDNPCLLTGETTCQPCIDDNKMFQDDECFIFQDGESYDFQDGIDGDFNPCCGDFTDYSKLFTTELLAISTVEMFETVLTSEIIDAKNRQTITSYPTLRALYERYLASSGRCGVQSSGFNYENMDQFAGLIGDYWVDIIEQVIPATTLWGSARIYTNTLFDQQKFKYRSYSSLFCENTHPDITNVKGIFCNSEEVEVITSVITQVGANEIQPKPIYTRCNKIYLVQMNASSEFIGTVSFSNNNENSVTEIII